jgi:Ser/Thr protein kinase RdoA (MazF antagonist)
MDEAEGREYYLDRDDRKYFLVANQFVRKYDFPRNVEINLLSYSENIVYLIKTGKRRYILRVNRPGYHDKAEVAAELHWLKMIERDGRIPVPQIIATKNGQLIQTVQMDQTGKSYDGVLFSFLPGQSLDHHINDLPKYFRQLGQITALLHNYNTPANRFDELERPTWDYDTMLGKRPQWGRWQDGRYINRERKLLLMKAQELIHDRLERMGKNRACYGLIHADLRSTNLLVESNVLKVIDFDDCGFGWFLYDLAASLSFIEHEPIVPELISLWLTGYRTYRDLSKEEEHEIPTFIMLRRLLTLAWLASHSDTKTGQRIGERFTLQTVELASSYLAQFARPLL